MRGLLILVLAVGVMTTRETLRYGRESREARKWGGSCLLLFLGWFPLLAWIANRFLPHY